MTVVCQQEHINKISSPTLLWAGKYYLCALGMRMRGHPQALPARLIILASFSSKETLNLIITIYLPSNACICDRPSLSPGAIPGGGPRGLPLHYRLPPLPTQEVCPPAQTRALSVSSFILID